MMDSQGLFPYGLRSLIECVTRATILSQPADTPKFLADYLTELVNYRGANHEADAKEVTFLNQEEWGKFMLL
uniref:RIIa domain-containing protein n=1 Tax=Seriola dumerili TaxID=41447 RepID=A0A3B4U5F2_SERDU